MSNAVVFREGRPIEKFSDDQLGRKVFARFFAEALARHDGRESLVVAVNAPWGEGKTSFKNMVVDLLSQEKADRVALLSFTPWEWASQNQVSAAFFSEIAKQLECIDQSQQAKEAAKQLRTLGSYLGLAGHIVAPAGSFLEWGLPGSSLVTFALGKGLSKARQVAKTAAEDLERSAEQAKRSLQTVKDDLRLALQKYLKTQGKLVLVIIDDIDRLSPEEIRLVFQMVRVNADFPAMVFVLLYDEEFVVKSLSKFFRGAGKRFLEKIVQFQTTLPVLEDNRLRDHLWDELAKLFKTRPSYANLFDKPRFQKLWEIGIRTYIENLRGCGRLLSSYEFRLGVFPAGEAEVNPIDFLVLELFHLFEPRLYKSIYENGHRLFPSFSDAFSWTLEERRTKSNPWDKLVGSILKNATTKPETAAKLFHEIFPYHEPGIDDFEDSPNSQEDTRLRRLRSILYFNRYFRLTIDTGDIPEARVTELVEAQKTPGRFVQFLRELNKEGVLAMGLTKLLAREDLQSSCDPVAMIDALSSFGDEAANAPSPGILIKPLDGLRRLVELQTAHSETSADRIGSFIVGFGNSKGVHLPVAVAYSQGYALHRYRTADLHSRTRMPLPLEQHDLDKLNDIASKRLENAAQLGELVLTPAYVRSLHWYLYFMQSRIKANPDILLTTPTGIALTLSVLITDDAISQYDATGPDAQLSATPKFFVEQCFGFEKFGLAIETYSAELNSFGPEIAKRLSTYRQMHKAFQKDSG